MSVLLSPILSLFLPFYTFPLLVTMYTLLNQRNPINGAGLRNPPCLVHKYCHPSYLVRTGSKLHQLISVLGNRGPSNGVIACRIAFILDLNTQLHEEVGSGLVYNEIKVVLNYSLGLIVIPIYYSLCFRLL